MYKHIALAEMLQNEVADILSGYPNGSKRYFWRNGEGKLLEIVECDLFRGRFVVENGDFSEFSWEIEESRIYVYEENQ